MPHSTIPDQTSNFNQQGNLMQDTLYNLDRTLQKHNDDRDTNTNLNRPILKGVKNAI